MNIVCLTIILIKTDMEIAASIKGASKEYKAGDTLITALQPTNFDFIKKVLALITEPLLSVKTTLGSFIFNRQFAIK